MRVIVTEHVKKRLEEARQHGISLDDVIKAAQELPGRIPKATRFRGFISEEGCLFDIVAKDLKTGRLVITVIGK
ncbi:hypothetical protein BBF96_02715 [Anoxybacter fermentans]|uniref:DUF4258 domain-containing protein n=1 Tax=Anoxybacter fermentans TaxID=1323375 RepID=A0A3S9SVU3_9FIRM|nr:hypothetical protein [Anoxybacter fermentans]AZR72399.1 hypothetical protein BBF96_02715 [Anoxybacter fermentans]